MNQAPTRAMRSTPRPATAPVGAFQDDHPEAGRGRKRGPRRSLGALALLVLASGCDPGSTAARQATLVASAVQAGDALSDSVFAALSARISEAGGFFDTDNLISNERGYLKVMGALDRLGVRGGAYVGVGPDQNFSYIARIRPEIAFITDVRRDNLLHHLLLKALVEGAPTRVEYLADLHGRAAPEELEALSDAPIGEIMDRVDRVHADPERAREVQGRVERAVRSYGIPLTEGDLGTILRFHQAFVDAGPSLRFTTFGRPPRAHYPTFRQLVTETDLEGVAASYLADAATYDALRALHLANRIIPVVGDMAGDRAMREMAEVLREMDLPLSAFYASNVEFYLWRGGTFDAWVENLARFPKGDQAVVIRSYFPNFGGRHPSAVPGYYATQLLQPVATLVRGGFSSYWDVVTRDFVPLR